MSSTVDLPVPSICTNSSFAVRFRQALADMRRGRPVILVDDFDRENEADLIVAAERITTPIMAMLIRSVAALCACASQIELLTG